MGVSCEKIYRLAFLADDTGVNWHSAEFVLAKRIFPTAQAAIPGCSNGLCCAHTTVLILPRPHKSFGSTRAYGPALRTRWLILAVAGEVVRCPNSDSRVSDCDPCGP